MAEFKIIHLVSKLLDNLGVSSDKEAYLDSLSKKTSSFTHISKVRNRQVNKVFYILSPHPYPLGH